MTQFTTRPGIAVQTHPGDCESPNQRPSVPDNNTGLERKPHTNNATMTPALPRNIPVLRWAKSGISIVQFLEDELDNSDWGADERDAAPQDTAIH